ncbi:uncharacterized protein LOC110810711 [Carica papaya]|uniref:uncharacterized protein LOC110810711 n=1 Tax=Carica papaya TaxID=3649 RepID=UPI000B8CEFC5|nr:uncharacterized protein LOC110810711 [Carica papaya]
MEGMGQEATFNGTRRYDLKKSFKLAIRSLLTTCSRQEFSKVFSEFTSAEQESLYRLFVQVITSLHESIEDEFDSLCLETQVGMALDMVEQLLEEQGLDPLSSDKSNLRDVMHNLSTVKKNEIQRLMSTLERIEEENRLAETRIQLLKKGREDISDAKLKSGIVNYRISNNGR